MIYFGKKTRNDHRYYLVLKDPDRTKLEELSHQMLQNDNHNVVFIDCSDISKTWKLFQLNFQIKKAAGGLVTNQKKQLLFIKRRGLWDIPKGHIEKGETKEAAALREVSEECGISQLQIVKRMKTTYHTYYLEGKLTLKPSYWFLMAYVGTEPTKPQLNEGITEAIWVSNDKVPELLAQSYPSIVDVIDEFTCFDSAF